MGRLPLFNSTRRLPPLGHSLVPPVLAPPLCYALGIISGQGFRVDWYRYGLNYIAVT